MESELRESYLPIFRRVGVVVEGVFPIVWFRDTVIVQPEFPPCAKEGDRAMASRLDAKVLDGACAKLQQLPLGEAIAGVGHLNVVLSRGKDQRRDCVYTFAKRRARDEGVCLRWGADFIEDQRATLGLRKKSRV